MLMVKIAVCDDNSLQLDLMKELLTEYVESRSLEAELLPFTEGRALLQYVRTNGGCDIYIIDIVMPDINGFEAATTLRMMNDDGKIIFLTASHDYAVASYDVGAFYYMLKPINGAKFYTVLDKATAEFRTADDVIFVKSDSGEVKLKAKDILYVDIADRALSYHLADGSEVRGKTMRTSFREAVSALTASGRFAFSSVSTAVNLACVESVNSSGVVLCNKTVLYPSRSVYAEFKSAWKEYKTVK